MYLVFDMGGTFVKFAIMDNDGQIVEKSKIPTINNKEECLKSLQGVYLNFKEKYELKGIAMSVPGLIDVKNGIMQTAGAITTLEGLHMAEELSALCDGLNVSLENDGKAAALAEAWVGAAKDVPNCCVLGFGTGIAGATIIDKKAIRGNHLIAGEASWFPYHYDLESRSVDMFADWSTAGALKHMDVAMGYELGTLTGEEAFKLYEEGNETITKVMNDWFFIIATQCFNLSLVVDPDVICIGGGVSANPLFIKGIQEAVHEIFVGGRHGKQFSFLEPKVVRCQYDNDSNLIGALYNYKQLFE